MARDVKPAGGLTARYALLGATLFLLLGGLVMVYSASFGADSVQLGDSAYHLKRQLAYAVAGVVLMFVAARFDYRRLHSSTWVIYGVVVAGLVAVLAIGVGKWGATRWIDVGGFTIQPSEYAKLACVIAVSHLTVQRYRGAITIKEFWGRVALACGVVVALVMAQPDMGTTMSIAITVYLVLLLGGIDWKTLSMAFVGGTGLAAAAVALAPYRAARVLAFLDPWADPQGGGYQSVQAMLAFGSGGIDGIGLGMSRQKFFYLPAAHTDFIFAIIGEELGLLGTLAVIAAFGVFAYAGVRIALGARDPFGRLLAGGVTAMIVTQALLNMAAVTGLMPVTGIPMPLVSSGGSSLTFTLVCIGLMLSVSAHGSRGVRGVVGQATERKPPSARSDDRRWDRRTHLSRAGGSRGSRRKRA
ncbi:MAG: putative lipid II flippase FtsW [Coriobacteriia bacterium]|nr:putative lipid II flippase FtsW [Coriobacteriia bacterium]